jgi:hypothetical protein
MAPRIRVSKGSVTGPTVGATGTVGAPLAGRFVGVTAAGPPTTGTYAVADFVVDQQGREWICITAGTPGIWIQPHMAAGSISDLSTYGLLGWSGCPRYHLGTTAWSAGQIRATLLGVPSGSPINTVVLNITTPADTPTVGQNYVAVWHPTTRALLAISGDISTAIGTSGVKDVALTTPTPAGLRELIVGAWFNASTRPQVSEQNYQALNNYSMTRTFTTSGITTTAPGPLPATAGNNSPWFGVK